MTHGEWARLLQMPTPDIVRQRLLDIGEGVLWASSGTRRELSAYGALAWENREPRPLDPPCVWVGFNLLCNAAPRSFALDGERFASVDSFHEALKLPEGSDARAACAGAPMRQARELARRHRELTFVYRGQLIAVKSPEHEALIASAIVAKVSRHVDVQRALLATGRDRLVMPQSFSYDRGVLPRVTPGVLMLERWKRFHR